MLQCAAVMERKITSSVCIAVCCRVLQCVAVCSSVLQKCVAVCCSDGKEDDVICVYCSVLRV